MYVRVGAVEMSELITQESRKVKTWLLLAGRRSDICDVSVPGIVVHFSAQ